MHLVLPITCNALLLLPSGTNLTITVTPSNCDEGDGLEVAIYYSLNCNTFQFVSNCDGDIQEGQVGSFQIQSH
ncbi:MAG: hypothetical protein IPM04_14300 [Saprospiraceae bacterium]|nr:hypothetical protein [Candidatus Brachybacter algidus]MBK8748957.1 hypothetical protein [Candidatus Brachybacter algidus]